MTKSKQHLAKEWRVEWRSKNNNQKQDDTQTTQRLKTKRAKKGFEPKTKDKQTNILT